MKPRDNVAAKLPWWLVDNEAIREGFTSLVQDFYREPSNAAEAVAHKDLCERGHGVLRRGWPDFFVIPDEDDVFLVEVKGPGDDLSAAQTVVLETLARKGLDVYVCWIDLRGQPFYSPVGDSKPWAERHGE